jgi:hypothetical protein
MLGRKTDLTYHERSDVRVGHDRFGVVVWEWVIQPGIGDRLPRRSGGWHHPSAEAPAPRSAEGAGADYAGAQAPEAAGNRGLRPALARVGRRSLIRE